MDPPVSRPFVVYQYAAEIKLNSERILEEALRVERELRSARLALNACLATFERRSIPCECETPGVTCAQCLTREVLGAAK
jgi:hypothetical protein